MKTANKVFADFCVFLEEGKAQMGIPSSWTVMARAPQNMVSMDKVILIDKIDERQKGFQNTRFETDANGVLHEFWEWIEEYRFQVSCIRERKITDTSSTATADEVAALLKAWVNSQDAAVYLRKMNMAPLCVSDIVQQQYTSENDIYQRYVHFDVPVQVVQILDRTPKAIESIELGIVHEPRCNGKEEESGYPKNSKIWPR